MLSISNLSHIYPNGTHALNGITLDIAPGMFGLLGPNGAGKSSLMRCLATLQTPTSGSIKFDGIDVIAEPTRLRAQLGYLPQDFGVYPRVSAYDLLEHLAVLKGVTRAADREETVVSLLKQVNLWEVRSKAVSGFSGGMRQRFGIAQALIGNPRLIIVDEPTAGLDPEERHRFNTLLAAIGRDVVVILSTHLVEDVSDLCSALAIQVNGRIVRSGSPESMLDELRGRIWRGSVSPERLDEFRGSMNVIASRLRAGRPVVHVVADACPGPGFALDEPDLEDAYFATMAQHRSSAAASRGAITAS